jgi:hypothetical protein
MPKDITERTLTLLITADLRTDGGTQPRGRLDDAVIERYAEAMIAGLWEFAKSSDPITAFFDGQTYWLADGFHRVAAAKKARIDELKVDVRQGDKRDAILYSVGANATHGHPRSNEDKRRAVFRLLDDPEWSKWSDREIARRCAVTHPFVNKLRASLETVTSEQRTYTTKHGTIATMDTSAIGTRCTPDKASPAASLLGVIGPRRSSALAMTAYDTLHKFFVGCPRSRPHLPQLVAFQEMSPKHRASLRQRAERLCSWAESLLELLDQADSGASEPSETRGDDHNSAT